MSVLLHLARHECNVMTLMTGIEMQLRFMMMMMMTMTMTMTTVMVESRFVCNTLASNHPFRPIIPS